MSENLPKRRVALALFEGFTVLDAYGPVQAFAMSRVPGAAMQPLFDIVTMAESAGAVHSSEGPATYAECSFSDGPEFDILLIPGGPGTRPGVKNIPLLDQLATVSRRATITATVCTGSALLARTGLLDDRPATSNKVAWDWVVEQGPKVDWQRQARWVDDGDVITSSGVSAGIDMTLGLIARLHNREIARDAANRMEYLWQEAADSDPFA